LIENVRPVSEQLAVEPEVSVFMQKDTPRERAEAIGPEIRRIAQDVKHKIKLDFIPREQALTTLKDKTGQDEAISILGDNPLPDAYVIHMSGFQSNDDATAIKTMASRLQKIEGVEYVQIDSAWVERLA